MKQPLLSLTVLAYSVFLLPAEAAIEFLYTIKERAFSQVDNTAPVIPSEWYFGAGASGDAALTAFSITVPGTANPIVVPGEPGGFDLETDAFASQAALDAAYPNGDFTLSPTDGGTTENYGPFPITGDAYPVTPHFTNAVELQDHDLSQDFTLTWNAFTGADSDDQIILQLWNADSDEELIFEFLDATTTSFVIPGGTLTADYYYDLDLIFANETGGLESPETIIGYLSTTTFSLSTHTSDSVLRFYKWKRHEQTSSTETAEDGYRPLASVTGNSSAVTYAEVNTPAGIYPLSNAGSNRFLLFAPFGDKEVLDTAYPTGEYRFYIEEDSTFTNYGPFDLPTDAYPEPVLFQNFDALLNFNATEAQTITWGPLPNAVTSFDVFIVDESSVQVWSADLPSLDTTTTLLPPNTLEQNANYRLVIRLWAAQTTSDNPPTELGYASSTYLDFETSASGGSDPGIDFLFTIKEASYLQSGNVQPDSPFEWSFGAGVNGGSNVTGGSLNYPGGSSDFLGAGGSYGIGDHEFSSQTELDAAFPNGSYSLNVTVDGANQALGPFDLSGDGYPNAPHIINAVELQDHDHSQNFTLMWSAFAGADENDRIVFEVSDETNGGELIFEFLPASATSFEITGGTFSEGRQYEIDVLFVNETDGLDEPDTIIGYLARTKINISTVTSDTELSFYKWQRNLQTGPETVQEAGYRPFGRVMGKSNTVSYAEINTQTNSYPLSIVGANTFNLAEPFGMKESLDSAFPAGHYAFGLIENESFTRYGYTLPPDDYPQPPVFQNFSELQSFDATNSQSVSWNAAPAEVETVEVLIFSDAGALVWLETLSPETTTVQIPGDTLTQFSEYILVLRFRAEATGSEFPDASLGYMTSTYMTVQTYPGALDYSSWLTQFFTEEQILNPEITGETADPDGDKLSNLFEFLARLNPADPGSKLNFDFTQNHLTIGPLYNEVDWEIRSTQNFQSWTTVGTEQYQIIGNEIQIDLQLFLPSSFFQIALPQPVP